MESGLQVEAPDVLARTHQLLFLAAIRLAVEQADGQGLLRTWCASGGASIDETTAELKVA